MTLRPLDGFEERLASISRPRAETVEGGCSSSQALDLLQGCGRLHFQNCSDLLERHLLDHGIRAKLSLV